MKKNEVKQLTSLLAVGYLMLTISNSFALVMTDRIIATQRSKTSSTGSVTTPVSSPTTNPTTDKVELMDTDEELRVAPTAPKQSFSWPSTVKTVATLALASAGTPSANDVTTTLVNYTNFLNGDAQGKKDIAAVYLYAMVKDVRDALRSQRDVKGAAFERLGYSDSYRLKNDAMRDPLANFINALYTYLRGVGTYNAAYPLNTQKNFDGSLNNSLPMDILYVVADEKDPSFSSSDSGCLLYHAASRLASKNSSFNNSLLGSNSGNKVVNEMKNELRLRTYGAKKLVKDTNY